MSILRSFLLIPTSTHDLSSLTSISGRIQTHFPTSNLSYLHLPTSTLRFDTMKIRMGGGPRTYPGGVSKWQWKRMQADKSKQLLKARLARERQIYEMRKRAELKAAVSELERPWEVVEKAPKLFSVGADEQLKVLADRFQRPGGFDMWSERDGPELFKSSDGVPSARYFPKGVVHSIKPYGKIENSDSSSEKPRRRNHHSRADMNTDIQRHVLEENKGEQGDRVNTVYLSEVRSDGIAPGEIRQKRIVENGKNSGVTRHRSRQTNYRDKYSGSSIEGGEEVSDQSHQTRYSGSDTAEFGYQEGKAENGNFFWNMRNRSREVRYSRNSAEGGDSKEQGHQMRYLSEVGYGAGNADNVNDFGVMRKRSSRQTNNSNRYSSNSVNGGDRMGQNHQMRHPGSNTAKARYGSGYDGRNLSPRQNGTVGRSMNRIKMNKDLDVYDMSVQQDGSYGFHAKD